MGRTWAVAAALAIIGIGAQEAVWRARGYQPRLTDDIAVWVEVRHSIDQGDREAVVLIGASRIQLACDLDAFAEVFGCRKPAQLAIDGKSPLLVLEDLARDRLFVGRVVCSITPAMFFTDGFSRHGASAARIRAHATRTAIAGAELWLRQLGQESLTIMRPECSTRGLARGVLAGRWFNVQYLTMRPDRWKMADYAAIDLQKARAVRQGRTREGLLTARLANMDGLLRRVSSAVRAIRNRGGQVVFVRFPSSGTVLELEEQAFPRARYWDVFAAGIPAPAIHFLDYPALAGFECPEGSHLDYRDATPFTKALARILKDVVNTGESARSVD